MDTRPQTDVVGAWERLSQALRQAIDLQRRRVLNRAIETLVQRARQEQVVRPGYRGSWSTFATWLEAQKEPEDGDR